jgi:DNA-binding beta-propeller fold protein YncE
MNNVALLIILSLANPFAFASGRKSSGAGTTAKQDAMPEYQGKVNAPDFPDGLQWLNTDHPIGLRDLRGKVVLLDFWTFCCINCMHIIPDLKRLEKKYANELVVIGVHSAKFTTERETDNIRQAILRYEIEHPVVNDRDMKVWQEYAVQGWPTLMLIDPEGKVVGYTSGEGIYEPFDKLIGKLVADFDAKGKLDRTPLKLKLERYRVPASMLAFPGKVLADEASKQLFIADSNHNRIVVVSLIDYAVKEVIGNGETGFDDGRFEQAEFNHPQGMALDGKKLYVADTENHALRLIDFDTRTVQTVAGTGHQAREYNKSGPGKQTALNSPWDLVLNDGTLYIAMAGPHQIWKMDLKTGVVAPYAGTGREARVDGPLGEAALAQPSGITTDGKKLYFADSEDSSIRSADLDPKGRVETIAGGDLFEYGDRDAHGLDARFQHPLGLAYNDGTLYVADTYNNKIKRVSPSRRTSETLIGTGQAGLTDGVKGMLNEPGGVSFAEGKLYIADTNNHAIRVADIKTGRVDTVELRGLEKLAPRAATRFRGETIELPEQTVEPGDVTVKISLELPAGYKLNAQAPQALTVSSSDKRTLSLATGSAQVLKNPNYPVRISVNVNEGKAILWADYVIYYCESAKENLCYFKEARVELPIVVKKGSDNRAVCIVHKLGFS